MRYAISYISFYDNVMHMEIVGATSDIEALNIALSKLRTSDFTANTVEEACELAFDCDSMIGTIQIPERDQ